MKTFKNVKEGEQIYSVDSDGNVIAYNITKRVEDWYEHMVTLSLSGLKDIRVNMDMYSWVGEDNTIMYFADKDNALSALREIAEKANKVIQNCLKSMDIFS
jgi:acid phosphatase class B